MDKTIDPPFDRVEKALAALVDSISKYNPSATQKSDLVEANAALRKGMETVTTHQTNHRRILALRAASDLLDTQIKSTLNSLASVRKDMMSTPTASTPDEPAYDVGYAELLSYARRISKTTLPPADAAPPGTPPDTTDTTAAPTPAPGATPTAQPALTLYNGAPTPAGPPGLDLGLDLGSSSQISLPAERLQFMNPQSGRQFDPWPDPESMRRGALASNARLLDAGIDVRGYDPAAAAAQVAAEAEAERLEEEERTRQEEARARAAAAAGRAGLTARRQSGGEAAASLRRGSMAGPGAAQQFKFMELDDEDEDED